MQPSRRFLALACVAIVALLCSTAPALSQQDTPAPSLILKWISDLNSPNYYVRQVATMELNANASSAIPYVIEAAHTASGEQLDRLYSFLSAIAIDPSSEQGKPAYEAIESLSKSRATAKAMRAEKILEVIGAEQRDLAIDFLQQNGIDFNPREFQVMNARVLIPNPIIINHRFTGNVQDLDCLKWLTDVEFACLAGPKIDGRVLQHVLTLPRLKKLQLVETKLTVEDFKLLKQAPDLNLLEVIYAPIGDESIELLSQLPVWGNMYLFGTKLTKAGQEYLKSKVDGVDLFVSRGAYLGVVCLQNSLVINEVSRGGAAERASLQRGDKLLSVNQVPIIVFEDLRRELAKFSDGEEVVIEYERRFGFSMRRDIPPAPESKETFSVTVVLGRRDSEPKKN